MDKQDKQQKRKRDEFLTHPRIAKELVETVIIPHVKRMGLSAVTYLEPAAGKGAFLDALPEGQAFMAMDLHPQDARVFQQDFLSWNPTTTGKIITFGNPPFGKNSSLAIKFVNKSAMFSDVIAMILPKTFRKASVIDRLHENLHLVTDMDLPQNSFLFDDEPYDVPCCFMLFEKTGEKREKLERGSLNCDDFQFVSKADGDFSFQRVGVRAGTIRLEFQDRATTSHYFIKSNKVETERIISILNNVDWNDIKSFNAGNPSISKREMVAAYVKHRSDAH